MRKRRRRRREEGGPRRNGVLCPGSALQVRTQTDVHQSEEPLLMLSADWFTAPSGPLVPLRASRSVFLPLWNNVDYSGEAWREAPPTEEEEEEEEEEGRASSAGSALTVSVFSCSYSPQNLELDHCLKPFIPDFIPAVGDIDAFLKVPRPDGKADHLGLLVLDEPSVKQSDPTVLSLWLSEETKQHGTAQLKTVTSVAGPQNQRRAVDSWVDSIGALHRSKPPATVRYHRTMPDIDSLMQEWPPELEELLGRLPLPPARLACDLRAYADLVCALLDVPVYGTRVQSLHLLFSLYLEFRDSQHFTRRL
uniref:Intraflagellar transport protein 46 homolog n=1 Tax=Fundulus heteroclitus TaxID=8078 RepID=A0A3Q2PXC9_FUNHE